MRENMVEEEPKNMFWGVTLDGGMQYTQTVEHAFHVSMAAVEPELDKEKLRQNRFVSLMLRHNKAEFLVCTLEHNRVLQQPLELNFCQGEHVSFYLNGPGVIHLTGYLLDDDDNNDELSDISSTVASLEEEDVDEELTGKRKKEGEKLGSNKRVKVDLDGEDEDSDEDEDEEENNYEDEEDDDEEEADDDEDEKNDIATRIDFDTDSSADEDANDTDSSRKKKKKKEEKGVPKNKSKNKLVETPNKSLQKVQTPSSTGKKVKKQEGSNSSVKQPTPSGSAEKPKKRVLEGSVMAEDMKLGHGPEAKTGKMVHVYYVGRIHSTGKLFDSTVGSRPFKFRLGKSEVIKGWDIGLCGMKVGGKRKLIIPPRMGYGSQRIGPIPPNSTLSFEIELKAVS